MRILFYLPIVTPWWFENIVVPMLRALRGGERAPAELHVMIAPMWRGTGIEAGHLAAAADLADVHWHVVDEGEPDQFRLAGGEVPGLLDRVAAIAPDLTLARSADVAIALDPDADRCAVGIPTASGWRMLSGDETGWLLGDYILSHNATENPLVASTVVSSRMLAAIATHYGATYVETLTGFKWLARADSDQRGTLVYAYEEAIGHCVDPAAVRDKDGISAAVLVCDLLAALKEQGRSVPDMLDELARRHGVHEVAAVSRRVADKDEAAELMRRLRAAPPDQLAGFAASVADITDALIFTGGDGDTSVRVVVRPSGSDGGGLRCRKARCERNGSERQCARDDCTMEMHYRAWRTSARYASARTNVRNSCVSPP